MTERRERWLVATTEYAGLTSYTGGIGRHYAALLPALVAQGVDVDLLAFSGAPPLLAADRRGVRLLPFESTARMSEIAALRRRARRVREVFEAEPYDRVFLPEWAALGSALPRSAPLLTNLATSLRLANEVSGLRLRDLPRARRPAVALQMRLESRQIRRSRGLVAISTAMLQRTAATIRRLPPAEIVGNCVDVAAVRAASVTASLPTDWPDTSDPVVLFLGRAERRKGIVEAFAAFGEVHRAHPRARLVVAGAGGDNRFERSRADLVAALPPSARDRVTWLGHVPGESLYRGMREAAVVLCPSRWEGFGNVALEAKAAAAPLVVTTGSGFDDFCVDGLDCLMVAPGDARALAAAAARVLDDPAAAAARVRIAAERVDRFAPARIAAELRAAADRLLGPVGGVTSSAS